MSSPLLCTIPETAMLLHLSNKSVWRLLRDGHLPRVKVGHSTRIPRRAINEFISSNGTASA